MASLRAALLPLAATLQEQIPLCAQLLCKVPEGKVTTYGAMAAALSSAPRAVGQVSSRNISQV